MIAVDRPHRRKPIEGRRRTPLAFEFEHENRNERDPRRTPLAFEFEHENRNERGRRRTQGGASLFDAEGSDATRRAA